MRLKKASSVDYVHQFSDIAFMKFKPVKVNIKLEQLKTQQNNPLMSRIKSFINWRSPNPLAESRASQRSALSRSSSQVSIKSISLQTEVPGLTILFLQKISDEHFLIGNQNQIDLVSIGGVVSSFIDTESLWVLNIGQPIKNLAIDPKKGLIAIQTNTQLVIYRYDNRKIKDCPVFLCKQKIKNEGKYIRFMRDSILAIFYDNFIQAYVFEGNTMRRNLFKQIKQATEMQLFQVPNTVQNCLNIFYIKRSQTSKTFQLWYIQMSMSGQEVLTTEMMKVYDIKQGLQKKVKLENYSKQIFLMNLGFQILAVKKGYIIDSAYLNIQEESTFLHYIGNNRLLHLSPHKAQIYRFKINFALNPHRIQINSLDSIQIKKPNNYEYIGALEMINRNFVVFYQIVPSQNRRTKGQITYCFAITKHVTIEQKIKQIFNFGLGTSPKDVSLSVIQERVDMARKIGLNRIEIYLQLWNRTNKSEVEQLKFLLDTLSYETIKHEIQKKMKKSSMFFRQVYKIQQSCFDMIRENLFSGNCNEQVVRQYITSHYLLRKLELYRDISVIEKTSNANKSEEEDTDALKINIQNYNKFLKVDIKTLFVQLIHEYCFQNKNVLMHIRVFLKSFRFIFRIIYKELLNDIVLTTKSSLIKLLENFPQLLPYKHILQDGDDAALYQGVWKDISRTEWQKNLYAQAICTVDNREVIFEAPKTLWFRRNFLTLHDMTDKSKEQILKTHRSNNSAQIFYFFISNVFEHVSEEEPLIKIISFVQMNYQKMPTHLHQKIFLYRKIFEFFRDKVDQKNNQKLKNFHDLLQMKDFELFKQFFELQKIKKGCILGEIKEIYQKTGGERTAFISETQILGSEVQLEQALKQGPLPRGVAWFNEAILSYFSSECSQVSDLKCILNRINNAKREFYAKNQSLIFVLVQAVQLKLRIGSQNDVPISEVLIYLQNIPLSEESPVLKQLQKIQKISEQVQRFQQIKIDMTISEITKNCQNVINALINQQIKKRRVMEITSIEEMKEVSYDILAEIQVIKQKIYAFEYSDLTFFVYLTKIMEQAHMIPFAAELLKDDCLKEHYSITDLKVVEDLILYMYKMKLTQNPNYIQNQNYLVQLLRILPQDNECRIYISCQLQYAKLLSTKNNPVEYPLTDNSDGISIVQFQERIQELPGDFILQIDIEKVHRLMNVMQQICYQDFEQNFYISINQLYETIILKLIEDNKIIDSIPLIKRFLQLPNNQFSVIFPLFYIDILSKQLTVQCKSHLLKAVSMMFNQPLELFKIVEELIGSAFTNYERDNYFKQLSKRSEQYKKNYNPKNPILDQIYIELIRNEQMEGNFVNMIEQCGHHLVRTKDEFTTFQFSLLFIILTQQPYALGKYIFCRRYQTNYKVMRSFLSYIIKEQIFDSMRVLQFGRRIFNITLEASQSMLTFQSITSQYSTISIDETIEFQELQPVEPVLLSDDEFVKKAKILQIKLQKCIIAFDKKKSSVLHDINLNGPLQNLQNKKQRIQRQLTNPIDFSEKAKSEYPFGDSDDDYGNEEKFQDFTKSIRRRKKHKQFNPSQERNLLMNRTTKNYALFMSSEGVKDQPMYMSSRGGIGQHKKLKNTKSFAVDGNNSLKFSEGHFMGKLSQRNQHSKRSGHAGGRISQEMQLTESIQGFGHFVSKSAVVKKRKSAQFQDQAHYLSPSVNRSLEESVQLQEDEMEGHIKSTYSNGDIQDQNQRAHDNRISEKQVPTGGFYGQNEFKVSIQQIDENKFMPVQKLKTLIFESVSEESDQLYVDLSQLSLQEDKQKGDFYKYLVTLMKSIYNDDSIKAKTRLKLIKQIENLYPDLGISKQFLDIYIRFQSYHQKYDVSIPMNQMFPIKFVFQNSKDPKHLFGLVCQNIVAQVDESNIYKISKIIHLAFKASSFQQEFFFSYLCVAADKFDSSDQASNQINMQLQKLTALVQKIPIAIVIQRGSKMVQNMKNEQRKDQIIGSLLSFAGKKKSEEQVNKFRLQLIKK